MTEHEQIEPYDPAAYPRVAVTVDVALFTLRAGQLCVLLVERGEAPFKGHWALPGGFVRPDEDPAAAAHRELAEETGMPRDAAHLEQLRTYGAPDRDPRMRVFSIAFVAAVPEAPSPVAGSDAGRARFWPVSELAPTAAPVLAFDHDTILGDAVDRVRSKLEYAPLAAAFCDPEFTIADLRRVYEQIWDVPLDPANFGRKVLAIPGFLEPTDRRSTHSTGGGRPARLYRRGPATELRPTITGRPPGPSLPRHASNP